MLISDNIRKQLSLGQEAAYAELFDQKKKNQFFPPDFKINLCTNDNSYFRFAVPVKKPCILRKINHTNYCPTPQINSFCQSKNLDNNKKGSRKTYVNVPV